MCSQGWTAIIHDLKNNKHAVVENLTDAEDRLKSMYKTIKSKNSWLFSQEIDYGKHGVSTKKITGTKVEIEAEERRRAEQIALINNAYEKAKKDLETIKKKECLRTSRNNSKEEPEDLKRRILIN